MWLLRAKSSREFPPAESDVGTMVMNPSPTESTAIQVPGWIRAEPTAAANWLSDWMAVTKARANVAVVATAFVGFALHDDVLPNWLRLLHTLAGTALLAAGASVANQAWEQEFDRKMSRTRHRPIAAGRVRRRTAAWLSGALGGTGCLWLGAGVNFPAMLFAGLAFLIYVFVYTPLKRRTPACTLAGAVSGALPILVGWAATGAEFSLWTSVAFAVLFLWQMPHFLAIVWWRRADYLGAGYRVLSQNDHEGYRTAGWAVVFTAFAFAVSMVPAWANRVSDWYWPGGLAFGIFFTAASIRFLVKRNDAAARSQLLASLYYLPAVYALMLLCRNRG